MDIFYEIHSLRNQRGEGKEKEYVVLRNGRPMSDEEMESSIEASCTLTKADVRGLWAAFRELALEELSKGHRVHLPGIGWLSLSVGLDKRAREKDYKIKGSDIRLRGIHFLPEHKLREEVSRSVSFKRSAYSTESVGYETEQLWARLEEWFSRQGAINCSTMEKEFGLSRYKATKWLRLFVGQGRLRKAGTNRNHVYLPKTEKG